MKHVLRLLGIFCLAGMCGLVSVQAASSNPNASFEASTQQEVAAKQKGQKRMNKLVQKRLKKAQKPRRHLALDPLLRQSLVLFAIFLILAIVADILGSLAILALIAWLVWIVALIALIFAAFRFIQWLGTQ